MAAYAEITNNTITNIVECDANFAAAQGLVPLPAGAGIGWSTTDGVTWAAPAPPPPTPQQTAASNLQAMVADVPTIQSQIASDAALFANTAPGSTLTAEHLAALQRMVNGYGTVLYAIENHAVATNTIAPIT